MYEDYQARMDLKQRGTRMYEYFAEGKDHMILNDINRVIYLIEKIYFDTPEHVILEFETQLIEKMEAGVV